MKSDFTIITKRFEKRPNIKIYGIADVHLGSPEHMEAEWEAFRKRVL